MSARPLTLALVLPLMVSQMAMAQTLPPPSRTVFKCSQDGKVVYSDTPCPGAARVDVQPTRGLNQSTGRELVGPDVSREIRREGLAAAVKPVTGMTADQFNTQARRQPLPADAQRACQALDAQIPALEQQERTASKTALPTVQQALFNARTRFRGLRC